MSKTLFAFYSFVLLATNILLADTIHFKNGAYIEVDKASEKDGQIEYWMGNTRYTIPAIKVEKITKGGGPSITLGTRFLSTLFLPPRRMQQRPIVPAVFLCPQRPPGTGRSRFPLRLSPTTILIGPISAHGS